MTNPKSGSLAAETDDNEELAEALDALAGERVAHLVKDAARAFIRSLQIRLAPHSVSYGHWTILRVLWESDGLSQRDLAERAGVSEATTATALKSLESIGYVERTHLPGDKKKVHVFLSKQGRALKKKLVPLAEQVNDISLAGITEDELEITRKVLVAMSINLNRDELEAIELGQRMPSTQEVGRLTSGMG
ncbi:MarR family transcriptional regulator [Herbaspirillum lusitanum]|uniref:MarR family transcriptional regulator n=1 Tax=Herbaspirillum lusitanum TaxID=213312 RepID=A0ABW9AIJ1_9BURK